ncbi:MAG TPA: hypothetical protein VNG69_01875 [Casimicrobiaceae bacterium]|nr:hypothetical protein [Casimicrobiaceae bacterium]
MRSALATTVALIAGATIAMAQAVPQPPLDFYKSYLVVLAANSISDLMPYYTRELREGLPKMPKDMQANYLKMNKRTLSALTVTKETVTANKAVYELTAKLPDGRTTFGTVTLVKEGSAWKVDDDAWATSH